MIRPLTMLAIDRHHQCIKPSSQFQVCRNVFEDAMVEAKAKARSFRSKATYAYEILHDQ